MAVRRRNANGNGHGTVHAGLDPRLVAGQAAQLTASANGIARIADEVRDNAEAQVKSLDGALAGLESMAATLGETATQAESIATASEELVSGVNEMAASIEQVAANTASLAASVAQNASAIGPAKITFRWLICPIR